MKRLLCSLAFLLLCSHTASAGEPKKPAPPALPGAVAGYPKALAEVVKYTPPGTEFAGYLDLAKARKGPLWERYGAVLEAELSSGSEYEGLVKTTGWDPSKNLHAIYLAMKDFEAEEPAGVFVFRATYDPAAFAASMKKSGSWRRTTYSGVTLYTDDTVTLSFPAAGIILGGDLPEVKKALDAASKAPLSGQPELQAMLSASDSSKAFYGGFILTPSQQAQAGAMMPALGSLAGLYFSMDASSGFELKGGARFGSNADATSAKAIMDLAWPEQKKQIEAMGFGAYITSLAWKVESSDLVFSWSLSADESLKLFEELVRSYAPSSTSKKLPKELYNYD
jgi:hypothetical protein